MRATTLHVSPAAIARLGNGMATFDSGRLKLRLTLPGEPFSLSAAADFMEDFDAFNSLPHSANSHP